MKSIVIAHEDKWYASIHLRCDDADYVRRAMTFLEKNHRAADGWQFKVVERRAGVPVDERDEEYTSWACEQVCSQEINVSDWIKKNRPDWLEET